MCVALFAKHCREKPARQHSDAVFASTPLVPRGASASRREDTALAAHHTPWHSGERSGLYKILFPIFACSSLVISARGHTPQASQSLDDEATLMYRRVWYYKIDSHGHTSLVKRQHSTRRRCIGLEGAVNTTASSVPLKHEPRWEGVASAKRQEPGELGPMPPAATHSG